MKQYKHYYPEILLLEQKLIELERALEQLENQEAANNEQ